MRAVARVDGQGLYLEDVLVEQGEPTPEGCIETRPPAGFHRPRWDASGEAWVEGKAASEIFNEAKIAKEASLRNAAESWYQANVRGFEGAIVTAKYGRGGLTALSAEERAVFDEMNANYTKLKDLISQARAATSPAELEAVRWT